MPNIVLQIKSLHYKTILNYLKKDNEESRLVGGCVRDALLDKTTSDIDIATSLLPQQVIDLLSFHNVKIIVTGLEFGTITAILYGEVFEITTLREDVACDGRHAKICFTKDFALDAARRDFTINAISYCPFTHELYDYFGGLEDLTESRVVFIGDPAQRIKEDYLRILRFFRISSYYANSLNKEALKACSDLKENISNLSMERIRSELDRLIYSKQASNTLEEMDKDGILDIIFSWKINYRALIALERYRENINKLGVKVEITIAGLYAILFSKNLKLSMKDLMRYKFAKSDAKKIINILKIVGEFRYVNAQTLLKKLFVYEENYQEYMIIFMALELYDSDYIEEFIIQHFLVTIPSFPISGNDLKMDTITRERLGLILNILREKWIESDFTLTKSELIEFAQHI